LNSWLFGIRFMFVFWKVVFEKSLFKLFCVCLALEKLVNEKYFSVKWKFSFVFQESIFLENLGGKHFLKVVKNLEMSYYLLIISNLVFKLFEKSLFKLFCVCLALEKLVNEKYFSVKWKFSFVFQESVFLENLGGKHFLKVVKNLKMSYYLLIISNLVLKLLIAIYILFWIFIFQFHLLKFNFYINFGP
jgi:hypothetical protein